MNFLISRLVTVFFQLLPRRKAVAIPFTSAGLNGPCYLYQETVNWETLGAISGILGAFLLAINSGYQGYGWIAFLASNFCWISFALLNKFKMLFWQQVAFLATTSIGLYNAFGY